MTDQFALDLQAKRRAQRTDPGTNREPAARAEPTASIRKQKILGVLKACGTSGANYERIGRLCGPDRLAVARRLSELERKELVIAALDGRELRASLATSKGGGS